MCIALLAIWIEDAGPVGPLNQAVRDSIVDLPAPEIVSLDPGLWSSQAGVDALFATCEQNNVHKFMFEGQVVDHEAIELEAPATSLLVAP
jgi:hypothetical protein